MPTNIRLKLYPLDTSSSRELRLSTIAQPFYNSRVPFNDRGRLARPKRRRAIVDVVDWSAGVNGRDIREVNRTVRGPAVAQHLLVGVAGQSQMLEELLQVAGGRFGRSPIPVIIQWKIIKNDTLSELGNSTIKVSSDKEIKSFASYMINYN